MRVAVLGATGVLGRRVLPGLLARGHEVVAVARTPGAVTARSERLHVVPGDILAPDTLGPAVRGCQAALHLATSIPRPGGTGDWAVNDRIRREGTRNLLDACVAAGVRRYVQQSIAMLHAGPRDVVATEASPIAPTPNLLSSVDMEALVRASGLDWVILRGGLFYGPDTSRWEQWNAEARQGRLALPGDGGDYASLIHVDDMAEAVVLATDSPVARVTLNIVDDAPVTYAALFAHIAHLHGAPPPAPDGPRGAAMASFRVANARAREALGWTPRFPDYQRGWSVG